LRAFRSPSAAPAIPAIWAMRSGWKRNRP
jgi:hypothetical protein